MTDTRLNPLIESHPGDTAYLCRCAVGAIARITEDLAELEACAENGSLCGGDPWSSDHRRGLSLLLGCVERALEHLYVQVSPGDREGSNLKRDPSDTGIPVSTEIPVIPQI